jgi:AcrR family transcriptional regulator
MTDDRRSARQKILDTAGARFYREGFRAVGIDTIIAESGVAKMTLYRHFPSKDDLIVAYLEESNRKFWAWFEAALGQGSPRSQLLALFEGVQRLAASPICYGCTFQHAASDFPTHDHPGRRVALAHKQAVLARLRELAAAAGAPDPDGLAPQLLLLMDGAFVAARMFGPNNHAAQVAQAAATLIAAQLPQP